MAFRRGLELLVSPNGWVDKTMAIGIKGMFKLIERGYVASFALKQYPSIFNI